MEFDKNETNFSLITEKLEKENLEIEESSTGEDGLIKVGGKTEVEPKKKVSKQKSAEHVHKASEGESHPDQEDHSHEHGGVLGKNTELIFSIICGVLLGTGFGLSYVESIPEWISLTLYIGAYFFGGYFTAKEAIETVAKGGFEIDFLMLVAAIGVAIFGEWAEGALLLFLFSLGHALEHYAMNKARKSIAALADLAPKTAFNCN